MFDCYASLALIFIGIATCIVTIFLGFSWWRMKRWMRIPARVTQASINVRCIPVAVAYVEKQYRPKIEYEYEYLGRDYRGQRITFWDLIITNAPQAQNAKPIAAAQTDHSRARSAPTRSWSRVGARLAREWGSLRSIRDNQVLGW
jgi:hypothetical protein